MFKVTPMKKTNWLLTLCILWLPSPLLAQSCNGVWSLTQLNNGPIEFDKSGFAKIQYELKKLRSQSGECSLRSVRLKILNTLDKNGPYFVNQSQTMLTYDPKEREYLLYAKYNSPVRFYLVDPRAKINYAAKYTVPFIAKLKYEDNPVSTLTSTATYKIKSFVTFDWSGHGSNIHRSATGYSWQLGELHSGKRYQADFMIRSNSLTELWVKSRHGKLINTQNPDWTITYQLTVNGIEVSRLHRMTPIKNYSRGQHTIPFLLSITDNTNLSRAGSYRDELYIQVKAIDPIF
ncbi:MULTISPECIES: hypothetical protein [Vibrio]|uniref:Uncharacterized protein n=3 Tax=Vibrio cyclitrophicus TaxID=47951 RepID=A0A7Z1MER1_9VIBR|nr:MULTISPECIES: hypothetical protein [Vibrio]KNH11535.1 hypothetical protein ACS79_17480 [Vibrio lentus]MBY7659469.1 hypothetical protein [Vibrio atlanticus]ERM58294.1 hypothetical protein M565_ctg5P1265 [Vibrio cyclitrophicus FF75]KAA8602709.1 hypothetical protein F0Z19_0242 [Vibrio cyclitrophicus]MBU2931970.1 hypothetical protein [Vibrio cyclitrophicus]|tara:strand:+ start:5630 stop:6499 length:870 start_codon:yes stop_codon:yes gene_type:complete